MGKIVASCFSVFAISFFALPAVSELVGLGRNVSYVSKKYFGNQISINSREKKSQLTIFLLGVKPIDTLERSDEVLTAQLMGNETSCAACLVHVRGFHHKSGGHERVAARPPAGRSIQSV